MTKYERVEKDLRKYKGLQIFIQNTEMRILNLKKDIKGASGINYEELSDKNNSFNSIVENEIIIREEKIKKLQGRINRAHEVIDRIDRSLKILNDTERKVLELYYMDNLPWFKVSWKIGYSPKWCKNLRRKAINRLILPMFGEEVPE